jgi:excisionase family DNA binding protein
MDLERDRTPIHRKFIARAAGGGHRVLVDANAQPFFRLADDDLLDSADLCAVFGVSTRTIYRWISDGLPVHDKVGREYLFAKGDVLDWAEDEFGGDDD